jgi:hypothetical protein
MYKKLFALVAFVVHSAPTYAGLYIGGQVGAGFLAADHKYTNPSTSAEGIAKLKGIGGIYGLHAGYTHTLGSHLLFFGTELYAISGGANAQKKIQVSGGSVEGLVTINRRPTFGMSLIMGTYINPKAGFYGKIGYEKTLYRLKYTQLTYGPPNAAGYTKNVKTFAPGLGAFYLINPSINVAIEYTYAIPKKGVVRQDDVSINGTTRGYTFAPREHRAVIKINYTF